MASDRSNVDDRALAARQCRSKRPGQDQRHKKIKLERPRRHSSMSPLRQPSRCLVGVLGDTPALLTERVERAVEIGPGLGDEMLEIPWVAEIGGDVVSPVGVAPGIPPAPVARAGDDPPAGVAEALGPSHARCRGWPRSAAIPCARTVLGRSGRIGRWGSIGRSGSPRQLAAHCASTRRGKLDRASSTPSGS